MRKFIFIFIILALFGGSLLYAQESVEQYLLSLNDPTKEDYINLLYEGSHVNMVLDLSRVRFS